MVSTVHATVPRKYEMQQIIGKGSYGVVWRARDVTTGKLVAVKAIKRQSLITVDARNQFAREVGALAAIHHRNVVLFKEVFEDALHVYIVTELCGQELYENITEHGRIPEVQSRQIARQMFHAINHLHKLGFVHRDVKPENFCLDKNGLVKLIDFGLCCEHGNQLMANRCGSYFYVAPEVLDREYFGGSCDVWSVGVVLFVMLAGYPPFYGETDEAIAEQVKKQEVDLSHERWRNISVAAKDLILRLLVKDPLKRISAAEALDHPWFDDQIGSAAKAPSLTMPGKLLVTTKRRRSRSLELSRSATDEQQQQQQHGGCSCPPLNAQVEGVQQEQRACTSAELSSLQYQLEGCQIQEQQVVQADPAAAAEAYTPQQPPPRPQKQSRGARFRRSFRRRINFSQPSPGQP